MKLLKAIEIEGGHAKDVLDDRESSITFFAPGTYDYLF
jgi:hypothetical protein